MIRLSLILFLSGLVIFLVNVNHSVFISVIWWIGLFLILYEWITLKPILWSHSPYYGSLSSTAWFLHASLRYALSQVPFLITYAARSYFIVSHIHFSFHVRIYFRSLA